jgi:hypothetical protein
MKSETEAFVALAPAERELRGRWIERDNKIEADKTCRRIEWLIANTLERLRVDPTGWNTVYRDPKDGRFWELTYPESSSHGGGPPTLIVVDGDDGLRR